MTVAVTDYKDGFLVTGAVSASSPFGPFNLLGGKYMMTVTAPSTSAALQMEQPDGSYAAVGSSTNFTTSAAAVVVDLPAGSYKVICTSTAFAFSLIRIPTRRA